MSSATAAPGKPRRGISSIMTGTVVANPTAWRPVTIPGRPVAINACSKTFVVDEMITSAVTIRVRRIACAYALP